MVGLRIGTSAFTAAGWESTFYPEGMKPADYLTYYATKFDTVEVDSTFYRTPSVSSVKGWANKTPDEFVFALKVPQVITHEKVLLDCEPDLKNFVEAADHLGDKLGPMLLQFPYFNKMAFKSGKEFVARLQAVFRKHFPRTTPSRSKSETSSGWTKNSRICCGNAGCVSRYRTKRGCHCRRK